MKKYLILLLLISTYSLGFNLSAQGIYEIIENQNVNMELKETSTLHDWEMSTKKANGEAQFVFEKDNDTKLKSLNNLKFGIRVNYLKNTKN